MNEPEGARELQCQEVWGGTDACDVSVKMAGVRGECWARPWHGAAQGGDIHYLSICGVRRLSKVILADVSGHGAATAAVSRILHDALAKSIGAHDNSTLLRRVNEALLRSRNRGEVFRFSTIVTLIVDSRDRSLVYAYAGHPSILRGVRRSGRFTPIQPDRGPRAGIPIGILPGTEYRQHYAQLEAGDVLVVYTDAFTEAVVDGEPVGETGLIRILEEADTFAPDALKAYLLERLEPHLEDDASLVILEVL